MILKPQNRETIKGISQDPKLRAEIPIRKNKAAATLASNILWF